MTEEKRFSIRFYGRVQGVGFRYTAYHIAQALRLTGWVRNEYDGSVSCEVQGERADIDEFLGRLNAGRYIEIEKTDFKELPPDIHERGFAIRD